MTQNCIPHKNCHRIPRELTMQLYFGTKFDQNAAISIPREMTSESGIFSGNFSSTQTPRELNLICPSKLQIAFLRVTTKFSN